MNPYIVGFDPGNSDATLTISSNGRPAACTIPAFLGSGSLEELKRIRGGSGKKDGLEAGELVLETAEQSVFVGRLALEQSADASSARGEIARYWSGHTLRLLMTLAGTLIKEPLFTLRVVSGLPVKVWNKEVPRHPELANAQGYLAVGLQLPDGAWTRLWP
jgi:hypothetical protein